MMALTLTVTLALSSRAQDNAQSSSSTSSSGQALGDSRSPGDSSQDSDSAADSSVQAPVVRAAGRASPFSIAAGHLLVGNLALESVEVNETWNQLDVLNPGNPTNSTAAISTGLLADIAYDRSFRATHLNIQYTPNVYIIDGHVLNGFDNQSANLSLSFRVTPRTFLTIGNSFVYDGNQNLNAAQFFTSDFVTQTVVQNPFLNIDGYYLSDQLYASLLYYLSGRTKLSFTPRYAYMKTALTPGSAGAEAAAASNVSPISVDSDAGIGVSLGYQLTNTKNIGVSYSFDHSRFNQTFGTTDFHTVAVNYNQLLSPTLSFAASAGVSAGYSTSQALAAEAVGSLSLIKTFPRAELVAAYTRYVGGSGFVSSGYTDRADLTYGRQMTKKWTADIAGAYLRGTINTTFTGSYVSANVSYQIARTISWFALYGLTHEFGVQQPFFPGTHSFVTTGLRWSPSRIHFGTQENPNSQR